MRNTFFLRRLGAAILVSAGPLLLAGCQEPGAGSSEARARASLPVETLALMEAKGTSKSAPVLIRAYKKEAELEIWKMKRDGRYAYLKSFPMCRWSGQLGPKAREGDRQVPEGFYSIAPAQMNPKSAYYLSFNVGYPNAYDRALGHGGGSIMVHGACSSAGCFSMTDEQIAEIYAIAREGFAGGQRAIQMQSYPFRMTAENLAKYRLDPNIGFWKQLKEGSDHFEVTKQDVAVNVCNKHYVFNASSADGSQFDPSGACPPLKRNEALHGEIAAKEKRDDAKVAELVAQGTRPVRTVYADGGQHPEFRSRMTNVSRPDALAQGPVEIALDDSKAKKGALSPLVQLASLKTEVKPDTLSDAKPGDATASIPEPAKPQTSIFSGWFGAKPAEPAASVLATNEPSPSQRPAEVPLPPRRNEVSVPTKPQASLLAPGKPHVAAPSAKPMTGAAGVLPTSFSTAQAAH